MIGISNEPIATIQDFIEDQGITFPVLHDDDSVYGVFNLPGAESPYPRDFIVDADGIIRLAKHEYEPGSMIAVIESLLGDPATVINPNPTTVPQSPVLLSFYPNPFNPEARIIIDLETQQTISLQVFDIQGRELIRILQDVQLSPGQHVFELDGDLLSSGVYLIALESDQHHRIEKAVKIN